MRLKENYSITFFVFLILWICTGCANMDKMCTNLEPVEKCVEGYDCFKYRAFADSIHTLDENGEAYRMEMLEQLLSDNGYDPNNYEILSRQPILKNKALLGNVYDVYYSLRVRNN
ncbi:MAG: hypothetical protein LLF92_00915 [Planctomycetaceae bacterium]|nr:hypothetical protein [Planctomycetaceae bacterium]